MRTCILAALTIVSLAFVSQAHAVVYAGNPQLTVGVAWAGATLDVADVYLDKIRMHKCDQTFTDYTVGQDIDPVDTYTHAIAAGNYCGITYYWGSDLLIDGDGPNGAFTALYQPNTTYVAISQDPIPLVDLDPYSIVDGTISVGNPELWADIR